MEEKRDFKDLRCQGKHKGNTCNQLLFKYKITDEEIIIQTKCPVCNSFTILRIPYIKGRSKYNKIYEGNQ